MREDATIHERTVFTIQRDYPGSQTRGFRKAIQKLQWDWENWDEQGEGEETKPTWANFLDYGEAWTGGIIPDLWLIDEECMSVVCIEVEDTSRINTAKLDQYVKLWWHLDNMYWETHLLCSDRWGNLVPVPLTNFTTMGLVETKGHHLEAMIKAECEAKKVTFELTKIYAVRDINERKRERHKWLNVNPGFGLRSNPKFYTEKFLRQRNLPLNK